MVGEYFSDEDHLKLWLESEKDPATFKTFTDKYIYGADDFDGYLELCGGIKRINHLRAEEHMIDLRAQRSECHA
jgi:glutaconate CoA-transferase subunit A